MARHDPRAHEVGVGAEDAKLDGKDYKAGTAVCFDEQGKVADCSGMQFKTL